MRPRSAHRFLSLKRFAILKRDLLSRSGNGERWDARLVDQEVSLQTKCAVGEARGFMILFSTVIEEKNERKAFEIGPNAHFYLDENVVWDLHFIIFFDICSMFLVNSISCPVEDGTAAPGNPVHPILYNRPDNRCPGNSPHSCSSMSPISDLV